MENPERFGSVCVPITPTDNHHFLAFFRTDWRLSFDVIDLSRDQMALLDSIGLWDDINNHCGTYIDIYEEATVPAANIPLLLGCIDRIHAPLEKTSREEEIALLENLRKFFVVAQERSAPVYFIF